MIESAPMGLKDRDYMKQDYEPAEELPRRKLWVTAFAILVLISFVLTIFL